MTIRLLCAYENCPPNSIISLDAATEAGMVASKLASTDLTGGTPFAPPIGPVQTISRPFKVSALHSRTVALAEGQALTVTGVAGTTGTVARLDANDAVLQTWTAAGGAASPVTLPPIGPYSGTQKILITCTAGSIDVDVVDAVINAIVTYIPEQAVTGPLSFPAPANPVRGSSSYLRLIANGVHIPTFPGMLEWGGSMGWDNRAGIVNQVQFFNDGYDSWYSTTQAVNAQPRPLTGNPVRLISTAGLTETGSSFYSYTGLGNSSAYSVLFGGLANVHLADGVDGSFTFQLNGYVAGASAAEVMLGISTTPAVIPFTSMPYAVYSTGSYSMVTAGATGAATTAVTPANGDLVKMARAGSTLTVSISKDSGATWTVIKTWTGVSTGVLYFVALLTRAAQMVLPAHVGLVS